MAKAFTKEEKQEIREKIMETALVLFHNNGTKALNISDLTKKVGIAQGSFYSFWQNKESFIVDLIAYRSKQKLDLVEKNFSDSLNNPKEFLSSIIYEYSIDLMNKASNQAIYKDAFKIFKTTGISTIEKVDKLYGDFLNKLIKYWKENSVIKEADQKGLANVIVGSFVLCSDHIYFYDEYFNDILHSFILSVVNKYIEV